MNYIFKDGGTQNNSTLRIWQQKADASYISDATNLLSGQQTSIRKTLIVTRKITDSAVNTFTAVLLMSTLDTLEIYDIQWFVIDPDSKAEIYAAPVTYIAHPETIDTTVAETYIVNSAGGGDYTRLDTCLANIGDGANGAWKKVILKKGTYWNRHVGGSGDRLPSFVWIVGETRDSCIVYADGSGTGTPEADEDVFVINKSFIVENITVRDTAVKYCAHIDSGGDIWGVFRNVTFIADGYNYGAGHRANQYIYFEDCTFEARPAAVGAYACNIHGITAQTKPYLLSMKNVVAKNLGFAVFTETDSNQPDRVILENCRSEAYDVGMQIICNYTDSIPRWEFSERNVNVAYYTFEGMRESYAGNYFSHFVKVRNNSGITITKGMPVKNDFSASLSNIVVDTVTNNYFDYVVFSSSIPTGLEGIAIIKGKTAQVKNVDASYTKGDMLKINASGVFEKTTVIAERVAVALETVTTSSSLLKIYLLQ